jgi:hypothetical protein
MPSSSILPVAGRAGSLSLRYDPKNCSYNLMHLSTPKLTHQIVLVGTRALPCSGMRCSRIGFSNKQDACTTPPSINRQLQVP